MTIFYKELVTNDPNWDTRMKEGLWLTKHEINRFEKIHKTQERED